MQTYTTLSSQLDRLARVHGLEFVSMERKGVNTILTFADTFGREHFINVAAIDIHDEQEMLNEIGKMLDDIVFKQGVMR